MDAVCSGLQVNIINIWKFNDNIFREVKKITSLREKLLDDMKTAMKSKDKERLSVIRMARAAIKNVEIDKRKDLDDNEVVEVIAREVKQRRDSIREYEKAGKDDIVTGLQREIKVLEKYLPEQLTEEEIAKLVDDVVKEIGGDDMSDMGKIMGAIMPRVKGRADGRIVNKIVQRKLS